MPCRCSYTAWLLTRVPRCPGAPQRGAGADQPIMRTVAAEVARGRWVHIFPEGKVNYTGMLGPLRWGVGKLVCDAKARSNR